MPLNCNITWDCESSWVAKESLHGSVCDSPGTQLYMVCTPIYQLTKTTAPVSFITTLQRCCAVSDARTHRWQLAESLQLCVLSTIQQLSSLPSLTLRFLLAIKFLERFQFFDERLVLILQNGNSILQTFHVFFFLSPTFVRSFSEIQGRTSIWEMKNQWHYLDHCNNVVSRLAHTRAHAPNSSQLAESL